MLKVKDIAKKFNILVQKIAVKQVHIYAAASDYYLFISLIPLLMLLISFIKYLPFTQMEVMSLLSQIIPDSAYKVVNSIVSSIYRNGDAAITVSILLTLYTSSGAMRALMTGLDAVYDVKRTEHPLLFFAKAILYVIAFIVIVAFSLGVMVYGRQIIRLLANRFYGSLIMKWLVSSASIIRYLVSFIFLAGSFTLMYARIPAEKHKLKEGLPGAVFSAASWVLFSWVFSLYVSISSKFGAYGYIGTLLVAMLWMFYCLMFLFIGGCINSLKPEEPQPHLQAQDSRQVSEH